MQNKSEQLYAGFFVRLAAFLLDSLIVAAALLVVRIPLGIATLFSPDNFMVKDLIFSYSLMDILVHVLSSLYFILLTYKTGATVGKKVLHLRVISAEERDMTLWEVLYRETVGRFLSALVANVGYFMIGIHKEKRGLHDLLSDTVVVYYHEKNVQAELPVYEKQDIQTEYMPMSYMKQTEEKIEEIIS